METDLDVLVVGGGPVGLFAAHELCRHGINPKRIRVIDKRPKQRLWCKAVGIQPRTQEAFYSSSADLSDKIQSECLKMENSHFYRYHGNSAQPNISFDDNELVLNSDFTLMQSQFNYTAVLQQYHTENYIKTDTFNKYNVQLERSVELLDFKDVGSHVVVKISNAENNIQEFTVKYLLGCDGAHSLCREKLDVDWVGQDYEEKFLIWNAVLDDPKKQLPTPIGLVTSGVEGMLFMISMKNNYWYIGADLDKKQQKQYEKLHGNKWENPNDQDLKRIFAARGLNGITAKAKSTLWTSTCRVVSSKQVGQYSKGRVYLAGDACHVHSPLLGEGMNMGLQDAYNLSWKLAFVINKKCSVRLLETYHSERYAVDHELINLVGNVQIMSSLRNKFILKVMKTLQKVVAKIQVMFEKQTQVNEMFAQLSHSYKNYSSLSFEYWCRPSFVGHLAQRMAQNVTRLGIIRKRLYCGDRCPNFKISEEDDEEYHNSDVYQLLRDTSRKSFVLLLFEGGRENNAYTDVDVNQFKKQIEKSDCGKYCKIVTISANNVKANEKFGVYEQCLFLIRPDGYIGLRSQPLLLDVIKYYLAKKLYVNGIRIDECLIKKMKLMDKDNGDWFLSLVVFALSLIAGICAIYFIRN